MNDFPYRTASLNAFVLTILFISMYGELRTGFIGSSTLLFGLIVWIIWYEETMVRVLPGSAVAAPGYEARTD